MSAGTPPGEPAVLVEDLAAGYGGAPVLREVSFAADPGRAVCVLGPNGGGKTTLFRALLGELEPAAGSVLVAGRPAYVAQTERTRLDFPVSAFDVALMGALARGRWWLPPRRS
ncbi:MAG: ATP-binding cassette domain-containing protein, partial [Thermoleophilaceae bacterium]